MVAAGQPDAAPGTDAYEEALCKQGKPVPYALKMDRAYLSGGALRLDSRRKGRDRIYWHCNGAHRTYNFRQGDWQIRPGGIREGKEYRGILWIPLIEHRAVVTAEAGHDESTPLTFQVGISGGVDALQIYFTDLSGQPIDLSTDRGLNTVLSNSRNLWVKVLSVGNKRN